MPLLTMKVKVTAVSVGQFSSPATQEGETVKVQDEFTITLSPLESSGRSAALMQVTVPAMGDLQAGETYKLSLDKG